MRYASFALTVLIARLVLTVRTRVILVRLVMVQDVKLVTYVRLCAILDRHVPMGVKHVTLAKTLALHVKNVMWDVIAVITARILVSHVRLVMPEHV